MMAGVTDNEPPTPPHGMDADEYRRFQEFQRFQDYQRFVEAQRQGANLPVPVQPGQPVPHHPQPPALETQLDGMRQQLARIERVTNPPLWKKILGNKWLHRAVWLVIVIAIAVWGIPMLIQHYFGNHANADNQANTPLPKEQSGILPEGPHQAVADVYMFVAENNARYTCLLFSNAAAKQFATALGTATCAQAVPSVHGQVTDASSYGQPDLTQLPSPQGASMIISSCDFTVTGGPRLGTFTLTRQEQGWEITNYLAAAPCPAPSSVPPTS